MAAALHIPGYYGIYEVGLFLFLIVVISVYRKKIFSAIKEFVYDIMFAAIFSGATISILMIRNPTTVAYLFVVSLIVIFAARIIYNHLYKPNNNMPDIPMPKM